MNTISTVLLGKQCGCVGGSEKNESAFFILLGYFVFVSENEEGGRKKSQASEIEKKEGNEKIDFNCLLERLLAREDYITYSFCELILFTPERPPSNEEG